MLQNVSFSARQGKLERLLLESFLRPDLTHVESLGCPQWTLAPVPEKTSYGTNTLAYFAKPSETNESFPSKPGEVFGTKG